MPPLTQDTLNKTFKNTKVFGRNSQPNNSYQPQLPVIAPQPVTPNTQTTPMNRVKGLIGRGVDTALGGTINGKYIPGRQLIKGAVQALPGEVSNLQNKAKTQLSNVGGAIGGGIYKAFPKQKATLDKIADFAGRKVSIAQALRNKMK